MANSHPSSSHLDLTEAARVAALRQGLWSLSEVSGLISLMVGGEAEGVYSLTGLTGPKLRRCAKTMIPGVKKLIECLNHESSASAPVYKLHVLINQGCTHTHTHYDINDLSKWVLVSLASLVFSDGGQCSLSISVFKHETVRYKRVIAVRTDFMFCQVTLFSQVIRN